MYTILFDLLKWLAKEWWLWLTLLAFWAMPSNITVRYRRFPLFIC